VIALDTNVIVRLFLRDNEKQFAMARELLDQECHLGWTVILEAGWVMDARYGWSREEIAEAFEDLMAVATILVPDENAVRSAIGRFREGADFADMIHLGSCDPAAEAFVSFDKRLGRQAGPDAPLPVRTIGA
jgi:predicted nucleic-acid-binding protein